LRCSYSNTELEVRAAAELRTRIEKAWMFSVSFTNFTNPGDNWFLFFCRLTSLLHILYIIEHQEKKSTKKKFLNSRLSCFFCSLHLHLNEDKKKKQGKIFFFSSHILPFFLLFRIHNIHYKFIFLSCYFHSTVFFIFFAFPTFLLLISISSSCSLLLSSFLAHIIYWFCVAVEWDVECV
jgi:hypothetical protein